MRQLQSLRVSIQFDFVQNQFLVERIIDHLPQTQHEPWPLIFATAALRDDDHRRRETLRGTCSAPAETLTRSLPREIFHLTPAFDNAPSCRKVSSLAPTCAAFSALSADAHMCNLTHQCAISFGGEGQIA